MPNWNELIFSCGSLDADLIGDALIEHGAISVTLENAEASLLFEPTPGSRPIWKQVLLKAIYEDTPEDLEPLTHALSIKHPDSELRFLHKKTLKEKDWQNTWKENYKPIKISSKLWICPSWEEAPNQDAINVLLDPGLAFGTGAHPTTLMCLSWLEKNIRHNESVIDYGCGSGILAIVALKLGSQKAVAVDIDPQALIVTQENAIKNQIDPDSLNVFLPDETPRIKADLIIANILANPLIELANIIIEFAKPGTKIALSGLLAKQADAVKAAYDESVDFDEPTTLENWTLLSGTFQPNS